MRRTRRVVAVLLCAPFALGLWASTLPEMFRAFGCQRSIVPRERYSTLAEDIDKNPTVFGKLLRREQPVSVLHEDETYFAFRNIKPYAPLAGLVIPKRRLLQDPDALGPEDLPVVEDLKRIALDICAREKPDAFKANDYWLRFHRRPFNSVDHLHLHVLAPVSQVSVWTTLVFFAHGLHAADVDDVLARLRGGDGAQPKEGS